MIPVPGHFCPKGHNLNSLADIYKIMLDIKYQGSRPSSFREECVHVFHISQCKTHDLRGGAILDPMDIIRTNLVEVC